MNTNIFKMQKEHFKFIFLVIVLIIAVGVTETDAQSSCITLRRVPGACVPILTCTTITQILNMAPRPLPPSIVDIVQRSHCGTFDNTHHVCCEINRITTSTQPRVSTQPTIVTRSPLSVSIRPSEDIFEENVRAGMAVLEATRCGKTGADKVANGEDAALFEFPWMALLVYSDGVTRTLDCGGSLITDRYVLTAAHCIRSRNKKLVSVRLGEHDTDQTIDCEPAGEGQKCATAVQEIDVEEAIYHKDYNPSKFSDDIGIIKLQTQAVLQASVRPICLPITESARSVNLRRMIIAGWGRMENGRKANILQKAIVPVITNDNCQQIHKLIQISENQMCAGGENEIDTCKGDSGGPMFDSARYRKGPRHIQYGIVSAGSSLCGSNYPGIYVRVEKYLPWIASNIRQ